MVEHTTVARRTRVRFPPSALKRNLSGFFVDVSLPLRLSDISKCLLSYRTEVEAKIPVAEMIGWSNDLRSATEGRGISSLKDQLFEKIPPSLQADVIRKIRNRKGLAENQ